MTGNVQDTLQSKTPPWLVVATGRVESVENIAHNLRDASRDTVVRIVRGKKMRTARALFDEFSAALQFPHYFGENWNALDECLNDLSWLPAVAYVIWVTDAAQLLADERDALPTFLSVVNRASNEWSVGSDVGEPWARIPTPFRFVLQEAASVPEMKLIRESIASSNIAVGTLELSE